MKKNIRIWLLALLVLVFAGVSAAAQSDIYTFDDLGFDIAIPEEHWVITRDTPADAEIFGILNLDRDALIAEWEKTMLYLNVIDPGLLDEIVTTVVDGVSFEFSTADDATLEMLAQATVTQIEDLGIEVTGYEFYEHPQIKFMILNFADETTGVHGLQYCTVTNGRTYNFTLRSYNGGITPEDETFMRSVVDTIVFHHLDKPVQAAAPENSAPKAENVIKAGTMYTDPSTGLFFLVPGGWKQEALVGTAETNDAKFVPENDSGSIIIYGSVDIWEAVPDGYKAFMNRADVNNSMWSTDDLIDMLGGVDEVTVSESTMEYYKDTEYFSLRGTAKVDVAGFSVNTSVHYLIRLDNGIMYVFQFLGDTEGALYEDYISLINSAIYRD